MVSLNIQKRWPVYRPSIFSSEIAKRLIIIIKMRRDLMIASAMQLFQLICYGEGQGHNDKALTWRKNLLTFQLVLLDLMKFLYPIFSLAFPARSRTPPLMCLLSFVRSRTLIHAKFARFPSPTFCPRKVVRLKVKA